MGEYVIDGWLLAKILGWSGNGLSDFLDMYPLDEVEDYTCYNTQDDFDFMCSECGKILDNGRVIGMNYCLGCGRKIIDKPVTCGNVDE